jgi:hypothetical protein
VHQGVELAVTILQLGKDLVDLFIARNIALKDRCIRQLPGQGLSLNPQTLILIADGNPCAGLGKLLGDRPGDAALVCQTENHCRLTLKIRH